MRRTARLQWSNLGIPCHKVKECDGSTSRGLTMATASSKMTSMLGVLAGGSSPRAGRVAGRRVHNRDKPVIGIIGAMKEEVNALIHELGGMRRISIARMTFYRGILGDHRVVVVKCGIGKVNATLCTYILIERFKASRVIFTGVAGALARGLRIGDIVVSSHTVQHDFDLSVFGRQKGEVPCPAELLDIGERLVDRLDAWYHKGDFSGGSARLVPADQRLIVAAKRAYGLVSGRMRHPPALHVGVVASGDKFVSTRAEAARLHREFGALCAEMEGAATGYICFRSAVPFVVLRAISDTADNKAPVDFGQFVKRAANLSCRLVVTMLQAAK